jgi:cyclopropane-fatty-acyl-phospholipid synthase
MSTTSAEEIAYHYDLSNDFYRLWLDSHLAYSAALWTEDTRTLEEAQLAKFRFHADAVGAVAGSRILEIGCGWGGLLRLLVNERAVAEAVGLTLSPAQKQYFDEGPPAGAARMVIANWLDFADNRLFDGIISIGAFEHFGRYDQTPAERAEVYRRFFDFCRRRLPKGGRLSLQTIAYGRMHQLSPFLRQEIWRESELPFGHEVLAAAAPWFEIEKLFNHRLDYARTLREWQARLAQSAHRAADIVGEDGVAKYLRYLDESAMGFENGGVQLLRFQFRKN